MKTLTNKEKVEGVIVRDGLFSLIVSGVSAAISTTGILTCIRMAGTTSTIDSGGQAFSANMDFLLNTLPGVVSGGVALLAINCSIWYSRRIHSKKPVTFYHFCSFFLLIPSLLLFMILVKR